MVHFIDFSTFRQIVQLISKIALFWLIWTHCALLTSQSNVKGIQHYSLYTERPNILQCNQPTYLPNLQYGVENTYLPTCMNELSLAKDFNRAKGWQQQQSSALWNQAFFSKLEYCHLVNQFSVSGLLRSLYHHHPIDPFKNISVEYLALISEIVENVSQKY